MHARVIKICGITRSEDAHVAVEAGANALGFNFYPPSPRFIAPELAARIAGELPVHVLKVGVFVNEPSGQVLEVMRSVGLDVVQLHGEESPDAAFAGVRVWKAFAGTRSDLVAAMDAFPAEAYLLDAPCTERGGSGRTFDWARIAGLKRKIVVAGGLDAENVSEAIRQVRPWGVDSCSRLESAPGVKDHARMVKFIEEAVREMRL
jgi:phosphoribosylanthranilate isomerase